MEHSCKPKHLGARNELTACTWLLNQGYEVFRNVSPFGDVDIIAMRDGKTLLIDVKSAHYTVRGEVSPESNRLKASQVAAGVLRLNIYNDGHCAFVVGTTLEARLSPRQCVNCETAFTPRSPKQRFCRTYCSQLWHYKLRTGKTPKARKKQ